MLALDSVVLYALDVVVGPYVHCYAPNSHSVAACQGSHDKCPSAGRCHGDAEADLVEGSRLAEFQSAPTPVDRDPLEFSFLAAEERPKGHRPGTAAPPGAHRQAPPVLAALGDVFVPRSEFCRRVLWLYTAESGLLSLYYPEEIPGEHYPRKTLRYTLSLNIRVDASHMTLGESLVRQLIQPYSVILTNVMGELRTAELKYRYVSSRLAQEVRAPAAARASEGGNAGAGASGSAGLPLFPHGNNSNSAIADLSVTSHGGAEGEEVGAFAGSRHWRVSGSIKQLPLQGLAMPASSSQLALDDASALSVSHENTGPPFRAPSTLSLFSAHGRGMTDEASSSATAGWPRHADAALATPPPHYLTRNSFVAQSTPHQWTPLPVLVQALYESLGESQLHCTDRHGTGSGGVNPRPAAAVRISDQLEFHVRHVPALQRVQHLSLEDTPVCVVRPSSIYSLESLDLLVRDTVQLMDGRRRVGDIVFSIAMKTDSTLSDVFHAVAARHMRAPLPRDESPSPVTSSSGMMLWAEEGRETSHYSSAVNSPPPPPADAAAGGSEGAMEANSHCTTDGTGPVQRATHGPWVEVPLLGLRGCSVMQRHVARARCVAPPNGKELAVELELPASWPRLLDAVTEAVLQLRANNALKTLKPWRESTVYMVSQSFYAVLSDEQHAARRAVGQYMLHAWRLFNAGGELERRAGDCATQTPRALRFFVHEEMHTRAAASPHASPSTSAQLRMTIRATCKPGEVGRGCRTASFWGCSSSSDGELSGEEDLENRKVSEGAGVPPFMAVGSSGSDEAMTALASSAALCAIGKFNFADTSAVQAEMRRLPTLSSLFCRWSIECCEALVKFALLNSWLREEEEGEVEE